MLVEDLGAEENDVDEGVARGAANPNQIHLRFLVSVRLFLYVFVKVRSRLNFNVMRGKYNRSIVYEDRSLIILI